MLQGGHGDPGPAAKPRVTDTLISLVFPALRCDQARSHCEPSTCYLREMEGRSQGTEREKGKGQIL